MKVTKKILDGYLNGVKIIDELSDEIFSYIKENYEDFLAFGSNSLLKKWEIEGHCLELKYYDQGYDLYEYRWFEGIPLYYLINGTWKEFIDKYFNKLKRKKRQIKPQAKREKKNNVRNYTKNLNKNLKMKNKDKTFKPFDKVLVKDTYGVWNCAFYSHWSDEDKTHNLISFVAAIGNEILPYEGNEHLVGTFDEPEEEVKLEEGEWIMVGNLINSLMPEDWNLRVFYGIHSQDQIKIYNNSSCEFQHWPCAIKFSDFNPDDMEETKKHILCVKNGKVIRYKG